MTTRTQILGPDGRLQLITTNGRATTTDTIWPFPVHLPSRNAVGVDEKLMFDVLGFISGHRHLWEQNAWRRFFDTMETEYLPETMREDIEADVALLPAVDPVVIDGEVDNAVTYRCGTQGCFAGWAIEVARCDWVIDAAAYKALPYNTGAWTSFILVRREEVAPHLEEPWSTSPAQDQWDHVLTYGKVRELVLARGFHPDTHRIVEVQNHAQHLLGIGTDPLAMFAGENTLAQLRLIARFYARWGAADDDKMALFHALLGDGDSLTDDQTDVLEKRDGATNVSAFLYSRSGCGAARALRLMAAFKDHDDDLIQEWWTAYNDVTPDADEADDDLDGTNARLQAVRTVMPGWLHDEDPSHAYEDLLGVLFDLPPVPQSSLTLRSGDDVLAMGNPTASA